MEQQDPGSVRPTPNGFQVRQRSRRACRPCQRRRRKCDGMEPCATCIGYGYDCHYIRHEANGSARKRQEQRHTASNASATSASPLHTNTKEDIQHNDDRSPAKSHDVLDIHKSRFVGGHSAFAFPMNLGKELNALHPPRLHSFASNAGTRKEHTANNNMNIDTLLTQEDARQFSEKYFTIAHPIFGFINRPLFDRRCYDHWHGSIQSIAFQAIVAGVCAIGSLFSGPDSSPCEDELAQFVKFVLEGSSVVNCISHDHVAVWILRSIYLRSTTRPHASWIAISTAMHVAEAVGLHREHDTVILASPNGAPLVLSEEDMEYRRRTFWTAWSLNNIYSCEYGRTPTYIRNIDCREPAAIEGDFTGELTTLTRLFSATEVNTPDPRLEEARLLSALSSLNLISNEPALLTLLKVDKSFCIYRRLRLLSSGTASAQVGKVIRLGQASLSTARALAAADIVWWNILGTPFQYLCILLAADSLDSLAVVPETMAALEDIALRLGTHMACEALATARLLVHAAQRKKMLQMEFLGSTSASADTAPSHNDDMKVTPAGLDEGRAGGSNGAAFAGADGDLAEMNHELSLAQWFSDGDINWDDLLMNGIGQVGSLGVPGRY